MDGNPLFLLLSLNALGASLYVFFMLLWGRRYLAHLEKQPLELTGPVQGTWPRVSLIAAARNEEKHVAAAARSLLAIDYPDLQITLVNDRSTDRTGEILRKLAAEDQRLNLVEVTELPPGWLGKNHALHLGASRSDGAWLLFTDADIFFSPDAVRRAVQYAERRQLDHLALGPRCRSTSWLTDAFVVTFTILFTLYVRPWSIRNPKSKAHVGIGAFNLVRATALRSVGGFEPIRMRPDDDIKLGKLLKLRGFKQDLAHGVGLIEVEWYGSLREVILGLEKNAFAGVDYSVVAVIFSSLILLATFIWPLAALAFTQGPALWLSATAAILSLFNALLSAYGMRLRWSAALGYPLAIVLFIYITWRAMLLTFWRGGIRWRDTHYPLSELRANKI